VVTRVPSELAAALVAVFVTALVPPLGADPLRASLIVTRDDGSRECPDSAVLAARIETIAGKSLVASEPAEPSDTWVQVEFVRAISGYHAVISARGARQGTRALDDVGPDCASLADAVAITLAILLDPAATAKGEAAAPTATSAALIAANAPPQHPVDMTPLAGSPADEAARSPSRLGLEASAGASVGVLEHATAMVEGGGRLHFGPVFVLGAGGGFFFPDRVEFGSGTVTTSLAYGYVRACANTLPKRGMALEACLEPMIGALRGEGHDYDSSSSDTVLWSAIAALFQLYAPLGGDVFWSLRGRVLAPLARHGFAVSVAGQTEQAYEVPPIGGTLALGIEGEL
jgi:hypothetical protein